MSGRCRWLVASSMRTPLAGTSGAFCLSSCSSLPAGSAIYSSAWRWPSIVSYKMSPTTSCCRSPSPICWSACS
uniref:Putative secreted peptide n=1 Tax=Anopheles braziliensis TaxID=58242 RepID=A0A2M3ZQ47_9DIPT